jgi:antitoxin component YwqK of YwqJK toxin-antitoxin module
MKNTILFVSILFLTISCSKKIIISEDQLPEEDTFYQSDNSKPYTGKCIIVYKGTEKVKEEMHFKEGVLNGGWMSYFENGQIQRKGEFVDGMFHGKWESWSESGQKIYEVNYENDSLTGKYITWYQSGKLKERGTYKANVKTGVWTLYDETGGIIKKDLSSLN